MEIVKLIKIQSPFDRHRKETEIKDYTCSSLLELRNTEVPMDIDFIVSVNGMVIKEELLPLTVVKPNDCIVFTPKLEDSDTIRTIALFVFTIAVTVTSVYTYGATVGEVGAAWASFYGALAGMAVSVAGNLLVNALLPVSVDPFGTGGSFNSTRTYIWNPVTTQQQGIAIPIVYGTHRVYGNIISGYINTREGLSVDKSGKSENQSLNMLIALCQGPVSAIRNILINDQQVSRYPGLNIDSRTGGINQPIISTFGGEKVTYIPNREVRFDTPINYDTPDNDFDGLEIVLSFPRGLFYSNDSGGLSSNSVDFSVEIKNVTSGETFRHIATTAVTVEVPAEYYWSLGRWINVEEYDLGGEDVVWQEIAKGSTQPDEEYEGQINYTTIVSYSGKYYVCIYDNISDIDNAPSGALYSSIYWRLTSGTPVSFSLWEVGMRYIVTSTPGYVWRRIGVGTKVEYGTPLEKVTATATATVAENITYTIKQNKLSHGYYEIQVKKLSVDRDSLRYGDELRLSSVIEVYNGAHSYPKVALVGIQALASEQISGSIKFSCDVDGKIVRVYSGKVWYSEYSNNPAWVVYDIFTQPVLDNDYSVIRYDGYDPSYLDLDSFVEWAAYCCDLVDDGEGGTEKRVTFNGVFDTTSNIWDSVIRVCQMSYATPIWTGTKVKIVVDKIRLSTQMFTIGNIIEDTFKEVFLSSSERTGEVEIEYTDRNQDYERTTLTLLDTSANRPSNKVSKSLFGITSSSEAARIGYRYLAANKYQTRLIEFEADIDAIACEIGDRIDLSHEVPQWGYGGRIISATSTTVVIDRDFTIDSGKTGSDYTIKIRLTDDTIVTKTLNSSMAPGIYIELTITGSFTTGIPVQYDPYVVGLTAVVVKPVLVIGIRKTSDQTVGIIAVDYYDEVYTFEEGLVFSVPFNYSSLNRFIIITSVSARENVYVNQESGSIVREISITFTTDSNAICKGGMVTVTIGNAVVAVLYTSTREVLFSNALPGITYTFYVQGLNSSNEYSNLSVVGNYNVVTVTTTSIPSISSIINSRVTGLQIFELGNVDEFEGKDCKFVWNPMSSIIGSDIGAGEELVGAGFFTPLQIKDYEVKIYDTLTGSLRRTEYVTDTYYIYTYEKNLEDGSPATYSFEIRVLARDVLLNRSLDARLSVTNTVPSAISLIDVNFTSANLLLNWVHAEESDLDHYLLILNGHTKLVADKNYAYMYPDNVNDNITPDPSITYSIQAVDVFDQVSVAVTGTATNLPPSPVASISADPWIEGVSFTWPASLETDISHYTYRLQVSTDGWSGWLTTHGSYIYRALTADEITAHGREIVIYIEVKIVDAFSQESTVVSANATSMGLNIAATDIDNFAVTASKIFTKIPVISGDTWTDHSPTALYVAWNEHKLYYNGVEFTIAAGNSALKYIYWDGSSAAYSASDTNPGLADGQFVIATNVSGNHDLAWNAIANEVIGSAYIQALAVSDAKILSCAVGKLLAGEIAVGQHIRGGQTAYNTGTGFFLGITAGGVPQFSIGDTTSYLTYSAGVLTIKGNITLTGGDVPWSTVSGTTKPADNATIGATWGTNLGNIPAPLGTVSADGLYLTSTYVGFYQTGAWKSYLKSDGAFAFSGDANNYVTWNGTTLTIKGNITLTGGDVPWSTVSGTTKPADNADVTLSAINNTLSITGGGIVLASAASGDVSFRAGKTDFNNTESGFILGLDYSDAAKAKFYLGDSSKYLNWNGSTLTIGGDIVASGNIQANAVSTAKIGDLAVTTLKIGDQAVTIPVSAYTADFVTTNLAETTLQSVSLVSTGAPIQITISCFANNVPWYDIRVYRDAVVIFDSGYAGGNSTYKSAISTGISDTPGAGTFTYYLKGWTSSSGGGFSCRSIVLLEVKK